ncbi:MAG: 2-C-methyl-D-erythritol 4-phosphate cytidylyltransferase [Clostridia bacterium]|nr:2-C-methyl-D-erythritol 4-phosphate cytidylyltransferase [Clostridia bacterium]
MAERTDKPHKLAEVLRAFVGKTEKKYYTSAVILAAGSSTRMGDGQSKQFLELCGVPVVARTIMEFNKSEFIDEIIVVAKEDEIGKYDGFADTYGIDKPFKVIAGGDTRQVSARNGVDAVNDKSKFIAIHDAARCLITQEMIARVCHSAYLHECAILAIRAIDTVKIGDKNAFVEETPDRKLAWQAQTPQVFKVNAFRAAAYIARDEKFEGTDDASLLEHIRIPVKLIEGSRENIKVTEPMDVYFAEAILKARADEEARLAAIAEAAEKEKEEKKK